MSQRRQYLYASLVGVVAAIVTLGIAELVALFLAPAASPLIVVGGLVIDLVPPWVKETAIALFGTGDKAALLVGLGLLVLVLAVILGIGQYRLPPAGLFGLAFVGIVGCIAAGSRAQAQFVWILPTAIGTAAGIAVLYFGIERLRRWAALPSDSADTAYSRRRFLGFVGATAAGALIVGITSRMVNAATVAVNVARENLKIPAPVVAAAPIPAGAELDIDGLYPLVTPNPDFYRIDTALQVPVVETGSWRLRVVGEVENEVELTLDELLALPLIETVVTIACVSNEIGGQLIGNAVWIGYPIRDLLARAKPKAGADMVLSRSVDGFTAGTPLEVLQDENRDAILAVSMNGEPLPLEHGFPVRMIVPGLFGYVSATKWVTELKVSRFSKESAYWTDRGWSELGPIKIGSRIDVPKYTATIPVGSTVVAGVAWAQHTGISGVEIRIDQKGDWMPATLAPAISDDTWVQWSTTVDVSKGVHFVEVRAADKNGKVQSGEHKDVVPDGAEGYHTITVDAE